MLQVVPLSLTLLLTALWSVVVTLGFEAHETPTTSSLVQRKLNENGLAKPCPPVQLQSVGVQKENSLMSVVVCELLIQTTAGRLCSSRVFDGSIGVSSCIGFI